MSGWFAARRITGYALTAKQFVMGTIIAGATAYVGAHMYNDHQRKLQIALLNDRVELKIGQLAIANQDLKEVRDNLQECVAVNKDNETARIAEQQAAAGAITSVAILGALSDKEVEDIANEAISNRASTRDECYRLNDDYPDDFVAGMRDKGN